MKEYYLMRLYGAQDSRDFNLILNQTLYTNGTARKRSEWFYKPSSAMFTLHSNDVDGAIGTLGFSMRDFKTPCGLKTGALAADFSVLKEHRNVQAAMELMTQGVEQILEGYVDFIYTIPNRESKALIMRTKLFKSVGTFTRHVKMISLGEAMEGSPLRYTRPIADLLWKTTTRLANLRKRFGVKVDNSFHDTNDTWFTQKDPEVVMGVRDEGYLNWRYFDSPDKGYFAFGVKNELGEKAVLVYKIIKNRAYVVDLLYPEGNDKILVNLFAAFESDCRSYGYSMIVIQHLGADDAIDILSDKLWYREHKPTNKELLVATKDEDLLQCLVESKKYWFAGDEDDI